MGKRPAHRDHPRVGAEIRSLAPGSLRGEPGAISRARALAREAPADARIHDLLSTALALRAQRDEAVDHARRALTLKPGDAALAARCVSVLQRAGLYDEALAHTERALGANQDDPMLSGIRVTLLTDLGRTRRAKRALDALARTLGEAPGPDDAARLAIFGARLAPAELDPRDAIGALERVVHDTRTAPGFRRAGAFQLGRLLESTGEHGRAFDAYELGNETEKPRWDPDAFSARIDALLDAWGSIDAVPGSGLDGSRLVFVLGMMRSGSSLLEQMLDQLPGITGAGEMSVVLPSVARLERSGDAPVLPLSLDRYTPEGLREIASSAMARYDAAAGEGFVIDKQTEHALAAPLLARLFPGCTIVHTTRDALDCCVSNYVQSFAQDHPHTRDQDWLGRYRRDHDRVMDAWRSLDGLNLIEINYDDLVRDPETQTRRVTDALGVAWDERVLAFHKSRRSIATASREQVREPIHTRSVRRAARFGSRLDPLRRALGLTDS